MDCTWASEMNGDTHDRREIWRGDTLVQYIIEVHVLEEWMPFDLLRIASARPKTASRIARQQLHKEILDSTTDRMV